MTAHRAIRALRPVLLALALAVATSFVTDATAPSSVVAQASFVERRIGIAWEAGTPRVSFSVRDLVDDGVRRSLASGLGKHIVVTVQAYRRTGQTPIASRSMACRVTYDLWEEAYVVTRGRHSESLRSLEDVLVRCLVFRDVHVGNADSYRSAHDSDIYFAVRAEFNPIAAGNCPRLLRSPSSDDPLGPVVVNIVRREICQAERAVEFRSPHVRVP